MLYNHIHVLIATHKLLRSLTAFRKILKINIPFAYHIASVNLQLEKCITRRFISATPRNSAEAEMKLLYLMALIGSSTINLNKDETLKAIETMMPYQRSIINLITKIK